MFYLIKGGVGSAGMYLMTEAKDSQEAFNNVTYRNYVNPTQVHHIDQAETLEGLISKFKTANSANYWQRRFYNQVAIVQKYHIH